MDRSRTPALERLVLGWPVPGSVGRGCGSAHTSKLPRWNHEMNPSQDLCNRAIATSNCFLRGLSLRNAYLAFSGRRRQPGERPQKMRRCYEWSWLKTLAFAKPNLLVRGSLGLRRKRFSDGNSTLRQSPRFGRFRQNLLKLKEKGPQQEPHLGFATGMMAEGKRYAKTPLSGQVRIPATCHVSPRIASDTIAFSRSRRVR